MKRLLTQLEAAEYAGYSAAVFRRLCPVAPKRVMPGPKGLRYDVKQLDEWIDRLPQEGEASKTPTDWLAELDGPDEDRRRKSLRQ